MPKYKRTLWTAFLRSCSNGSEIYTIIFPNQLFKNHPALANGRKILIVEEWLFFNQYKFHKQKLVLHRASMQYFKKLLQHNGYEVNYVSATHPHSDVRKLIPHLQEQGITAIYSADVVDDWLSRRMTAACKKCNISLHELITPAFLNTMPEANAYFDSRKSYFQTDFYIAERKKRNILVENGKHPEGGQWSFDADNRSKFPKSETVPLVPEE